MKHTLKCLCVCVCWWVLLYVCMPVKHTHSHSCTHMKGQKKVLPLKMSKNYTEKEKTHMRSSFSKLVLVFWATSKRNMKIVIYTHTQYTNACLYVCVLVCVCVI